MTDNDFNTLASMKKQFVYQKNVQVPHDKQFETYKIKSYATKDKFFLYYDRRGTYELKQKGQIQYKKDFSMIRMEVNAPPHINPDGSAVSRNHIHIYKEGYELRWAYELSDILKFSSNDTTPLNLFISFCEYCKIDISNISKQEVF